MRCVHPYSHILRLWICAAVLVLSTVPALAMDTAPGALAVGKTVSSYDAGPFLQYLELRSIHRIAPTAKI